MNKNIKYNGFTTVPSDYECADGDLAQSLNLISEDGCIKNLHQPKQIMAIGNNRNVLFIHKTSAFTHYIIYDDSDNKLYYYDTATKKTSSVSDISFTTLDHIDAVGNTLMLFCSNMMYYILWSNDSYIALGNKLPNAEVSFGLVGHPRLYSISDDSKSTFDISFDKIAEDEIRSDFSTDNKTKITEQIMAKVNKFIAAETVNKGRFCFPFFVRYALRLFDGSLVCHSAPILMNPSTLPAPLVLWDRVKGKSSYTSATCDIMLVAATLDYRASLPSGIDNWKDIISSIDVFISKPIYTYDQSGEISNLVDNDNFDTKFIGRLYHKNYSVGDTSTTFSTDVAEDCILAPMGSDINFLKNYAEWSYSQIYALYFSKDRKYPGDTFHMPEFSEGKIQESLTNCCNFYKLCSISIEEAQSSADATSRTDIAIEDDYLQSLVTRELMTDDYLTHDRIFAESSQAFNQRINLSGVSRDAFKGFPPACMWAYSTVDALNWATNGTTINISVPLTTDYVTIYVYINEGGSTHIVSTAGSCAAWCSSMKYPTEEDATNKTNGSWFKKSWGCFLFYPNANATKMIIQSNFGRKDGYQSTFAIDLKAHDYLNGAYALLDYDQTRIDSGEGLPSQAPNTIIQVPNKIYTSEVNNPFYFPLTGINTVGTGKILNIATAAKALSQGQFGQFPLYAFTNEGVWALETTSTGTYSAKQPITRDVCVNADSITQIDSAVLFATSRGIMLISGSEASCLTDIINSNHPFDIAALPGMDQLHSRLHTSTDQCSSIIPFSEFLEMCSMIYDYVHQHIILFAPGQYYAYVYSFKSQNWGLMQSNITSRVNSYPNAMAMDANHNLVDFSIDDDLLSVTGLLVTRPLKLDDANIHKTIDTIIQRGLFRRGNVQSLLYGSRDLINWHLVWSSKDHYLRGFRGTPYKYFRIALLTEMSDDESLFGASVRYSPRIANRPR
jgi:hypothetical protein